VLTLRHMRYFVALSEELHFGRAATRLHMTQPALSQQIQQLERIVQVPLLYRNNRMVELTSAGSAFLGQARRVLAAADRAIEVAHEAATSVGLLRVGYSSTMDWLFIPQLTDAVARSTANVVWRSLTEEISNRDILDRRFDVAVTRHFERTDGVEHEVVLWERPGLYVNADDPLAALDEIQFSCLEGRRVRSLFPEFAPLRHAALLEDLARADVHLELDPTLGYSRQLTAREISSGMYVVIGYVTASTVFPGIAVVPMSREARPIPVALAWQSGDDRQPVGELLALAREIARTATLPQHVWRA
jgi:DNA-binding transcriptional LysR family regulator